MMKKNKYYPTAKSYFSGAGGLDCGIRETGIKIVQSYEIDEKCIDVLQRNFNHEIISTDVRNITVLDQPKTDVMFGTFPCTKYSPIADISGTRTGDELFLHMFRHIALERPEVYVIENVPGMKKFPIVMEAMSKIPDYYVQIFCPLKTSTWLPQRRERLILIGSKKPMNITPPIGTKPVRLKDIMESNPDMKIPKYVLSRLNGDYRDKPIISDPNDINAIAPTCVAHYAKDIGTRMVKDKKHPLGVRPYTTKEWARLQGFPDSFDWGTAGDRDIYRMVGNAVPVPMARWIGENIVKYFNT